MPRRKGGSKKGVFTIGPEHWCGMKKPDGNLCRMARQKGQPTCHKHNLTRDDVWAAPGVAALELADSDLKTNDDVIKFLGDIINATKNNKMNRDQAKDIVGMCKVLLGAIKQRDDNSPEGLERIAKEAAAVKAIMSGGMNAERATARLTAEKFLITEQVIEAEIREVFNEDAEI